MRERGTASRESNSSFVVALVRLMREALLLASRWRAILYVIARVDKGLIFILIYFRTQHLFKFFNRVS